MNKRLIILLVFIFIAAFIAGIFVFKDEKNAGQAERSSEMQKIIATDDLAESTELYRELLTRVGPAEAQEELLNSGLPFTGETHLLNHASGEYIYGKYGPVGLKECRDYFLSSCYHGFIIKAISVGGMEEVGRVIGECKKLDGNVFSQCSHALGHGFLAYLGYKNLISALELCDKAKAGSPELPIFNCYDGVFMENVWGVHDGKPSPDRWVRSDNPEYPCNDKRLDKKYLSACWANQPTLLYQNFRGDIKKVSDVCLAVTGVGNRRICFDGLARQIHPVAAGNFSATIDMCKKVDADWVNECLSSNMVAAFSVGDRVLPFQLCAWLSRTGGDDCNERLLKLISSYAKTRAEITGWCGKIDDHSWREKCLIL